MKASTLLGYDHQVIAEHFGISPTRVAEIAGQLAPWPYLERSSRPPGVHTTSAMVIDEATWIVVGVLGDVDGVSLRPEDPGDWATLSLGGPGAYILWGPNVIGHLGSRIVGAITVRGRQPVHCGLSFLVL